MSSVAWDCIHLCRLDSALVAPSRAMSAPSLLACTTQPSLSLLSTIPTLFFQYLASLVSTCVLNPIIAITKQKVIVETSKSYVKMAQCDFQNWFYCLLIYHGRNLMVVIIMSSNWAKWATTCFESTDEWQLLQSLRDSQEKPRLCKNVKKLAFRVRMDGIWSSWSI